MGFQNFFPEKSLLNDGFWLSIERMILIGKGLVLAYLFANYLSKDIFGQYQFLLAILGIFSLTALPGMGTAIVQAIARGMDGTFSLAVRAVFRASIVGCAGILFVAIYYFWKGEIILFLPLLILSIAFPFYSVSSLWRYYYTGRLNFRGLCWMSFILEISALACFIPVILWRPGLLWVVAVGIIFPVALSLILLRNVYSKTVQKQIDHSNIFYGKNLSWSFGLIALSGYFDKIFLGHSLGFSELASFSIALMIPEQVKGSVGALITPLLSHYSDENKQTALRKNFIFFSTIAFFLVGVTFFVIPTFFEIFFPSYISSIKYAEALLGIVIFTPFLSLELYFRAIKNERAVMLSTVLSSFFSLLVAFLLIPVWGIWGAVIARLIGSFAYALILAVFLIKKAHRKVI